MVLVTLMLSTIIILKQGRGVNTREYSEKSDEPHWSSPLMAVMAVMAVVYDVDDVVVEEQPWRYHFPGPSSSQCRSQISRVIPIISGIAVAPTARPDLSIFVVRLQSKHLTTGLDEACEHGSNANEENHLRLTYRIECVRPKKFSYSLDCDGLGRELRCSFAVSKTHHQSSIIG